MRCRGGGKKSEIQTGESLSRLLLQHPKEISSSTIVHDKMQFVLGLESAIEGDDEGMFDCCKYLPLCHDSLHLSDQVSPGV